MQDRQSYVDPVELSRGGKSVDRVGAEQAAVTAEVFGDGVAQVEGRVSEDRLTGWTIHADP